MEYTTVTHTFEPIFNAESRVLILGSLPSVKSRENQFYYGHPKNRFWTVLATILKCDIPVTIEEKKAMLLANHIAIWDVIASCDIIGSSDSSIKNVTANDMSVILDYAPIEKIYANGAKAEELYRKYCYPKTQITIERLPSTSPANASCKLQTLIEVWRKCVP